MAPMDPTEMIYAALLRLETATDTGFEGVNKKLVDHEQRLTQVQTLLEERTAPSRVFLAPPARRTLPGSLWSAGISGVLLAAWKIFKSLGRV